MQFAFLSLRRTLVLFAAFHACTAKAGNEGEKNAWTAFQTAVAHDDRTALAAVMRFPVEWENLAIRSIESEADLIKRYPLIFTEEIKHEIARGNPVKCSGGYSVDWKGRGKRSANSYSLIFKAQGGGRFTLDGLYEGPRD